MDVKTYAIELGSRLDLPGEAIHTVLPLVTALEESGDIDAIWQRIQEERGMAVIRSYTAKYHCGENQLAFAATLLLTRNMREVYEREGYHMDIYWNSLQDVRIWLGCCKEETGLWGMKQFDWLCGTLKAKLWRLGRMQFERITYEEGPYSGNGITLQDGDTVINTHIPQGEPLTDALRTDAFAQAVRFFGSNVFLCESWMLWPAHYEMLKPESNVIAFMNDFDIFKQKEIPGVADLWRIFGYLPEYTPDRLPEKTSMQRAYKKRLKENGGLTGFGYGIHVHKATTDA